MVLLLAESMMYSKKQVALIQISSFQCMNSFNGMEKWYMAFSNLLPAYFLGKMSFKDTTPPKIMVIIVIIRPILMCTRQSAKNCSIYIWNGEQMANQNISLTISAW